MSAVRRNSLAGLMLALPILAMPAIALADDWDGYDDKPVRRMPDLAHGSNEVHDLAARPGPLGDIDLSWMPQDPYSSWEVTIDGLTEPAVGTKLQRLTSDGTVILQHSTSPTVAGGYSRTVAWANASPSAAIDLIRVYGADCAATCTAASRYRIRAYDTTISVPRFNNSGTQVTVLLVQNTRAAPHAGTVYFWDAMGAPVASAPLNLAPKALQVLNTSTIAPGSSGSITIVHDSGYGGLSAKSVALEPATGFSFDTQGTYKPK
ncbi:MAG: hypothetical protein KA280_09215 [Thermomonas sp.]|nr:hypothetical protein [Thermomonas sp.]